MRRSFSKPTSNRGGKVFRNNKFGNKRPKQQGKYINPQMFVNKAIHPQAEDVFEPNHKFSDFAFSQLIKQNIEKKGYVEPTPIQDGTIKHALEGKDVIGLANTGTGKTAAFVLPIIEKLSSNNDGSTALIMAPTRELAFQIYEELKVFAAGTGVHAALCVGGASMNAQIHALKRRPRVVIGTPGRLKDLLDKGILRLDRANTIVLDEADRMVDIGFIREIRYILGKLPEKKQALCFSATLTSDIKDLLKNLMTDPVTVSVIKAATSNHVEQDVIKASTKEEKIQILTELLKRDNFEKVIVFGSTKHGVQKLSDNLVKSDVSAIAIHGNKSQPQRQKALDAFKKGKVKVLVATDVAARGLDIPLVSHVINFDQPQTYDDYIHRIGRTGRAGNRGHALTFVS